MYFSIFLFLFINAWTWRGIAACTGPNLTLCIWIKTIILSLHLISHPSTCPIAGMKILHTFTGNFSPSIRNSSQWAWSHSDKQGRIGSPLIFAIVHHRQWMYIQSHQIHSLLQELTEIICSRSLCGEKKIPSYLDGLQFSLQSFNICFSNSFSSLVSTPIQYLKPLTCKNTWVWSYYTATVE